MIKSKEPCPACREKGEDKSGDNLNRYDDGGAHCFKCKYTERAGMATKDNTAKPSKLTVAQVKSYPVGANPERKINDDVAKMYDIRYSVNEVDGQLRKVYYPYYKDGNIVAAKIRDVHTRVFSCTGPLPGMFGKQACTSIQDTLLVTEGEEDALALKSILLENRLGYHVVSMPNGASLDAAVEGDLDFFEKYRRVYLLMDADDPGQKVQEKVADWLAAVCTVYKVKLTHHKDASEYRMAGHDKELIADIKKAQEHEPEGVVCGSDIDINDLLRPLERGYEIPYPGLQDKLLGLRKAEIVTLCAGTGIGKSTFSRELAHSLISQGAKVAMVALEDQMNVTAQAMVALDMDMPLFKFRASPPDIATMQPHYDKMLGAGNLFLYKHFGGLNTKSLMNRLNYYARAKQCDFIMLDHLSSVIAASKESNERQAIDHVMDELSKLVIETGVGLIMVVHLKRPTGDKSFAKGGEVELSDLRGSAAIEQYSWAVIGLERDQQGEDADFSRARVLKNRTIGFTGLADTMKYDPATGRLQHFKLEDPPTEEETDELIP